MRETDGPSGRNSEFPRGDERAYLEARGFDALAPTFLPIDHREKAEDAPAGVGDRFDGSEGRGSGRDDVFHHDYRHVRAEATLDAAPG